MVLEKNVNVFIFLFFLETRNMDRNVLKQTPLSALLNTNLGAGEKLSVIIYS